MRTQTVNLTIVSGISAAIRDWLAEWDSVYNLGDAVQMDAETIEELIDDKVFPHEINKLLTELLIDFSDTSVFQFTP